MTTKVTPVARPSTPSVRFTAERWALGFTFGTPLILIPVGVVYIAETLSDIIQVAYFKATHGKRFFKMAPLHHHLELSGWSETKLVVVFSGITAVCCVLAYLGVRARY